MHLPIIHKETLWKRHPTFPSWQSVYILKPHANNGPRKLLFRTFVSDSLKLLAYRGWLRIMPTTGSRHADSKRYSMFSLKLTQIINLLGKQAVEIKTTECRTYKHFNDQCLANSWTITGRTALNWTEMRYWTAVLKCGTELKCGTSGTAYKYACGFQRKTTIATSR